MTRRRKENPTDEFNIWPAFTDLMANAFMIISLFFFLALFKSLFLKSTAEVTQLNLAETEGRVLELEGQIDRLGNQIRNRNEQLNTLASEAELLAQELAERNEIVDDLTQEVKKLKLAPPVVVIQDSGEFQFDSGSAQLSGKLQEYINSELVSKIEQITQERDIYTVEIIGHTDGQVTLKSASNLDQTLEAVASGEKDVQQLIPGSNADLGLMRALEVVKELQAIQGTGRLPGIQFRAYSAAQLLLPSGEFAPGDRSANSERRRIEIRFSPLGQAETIR